MSDGAAGDSSASSSVPPSRRPTRRRRFVLERVASIGASAQAAIPGLYAWAITVAPAAWSRGAPVLAQIAAVVGVVALVTAPVVEGSGPSSRRRRSWGRGPMWARGWSVWGFVLSSATVWALAPGALSSARLDGVRGALGMVGWGLFAFASAGPVLRHDPNAADRIVASTSLKPRSELPRGDGAYVAVGVVLALVMQAVVGWGVPTPERAVLVRLVTVVCGIAVLGGTTSIALARHSVRASSSKRVRIGRALGWLVMLVLFVVSGIVVGIWR